MHLIEAYFRLWLILARIAMATQFISKLDPADVNSITYVAQHESLTSQSKDCDHDEVWSTGDPLHTSYHRLHGLTKYAVQMGIRLYLLAVAEPKTLDTFPIE